MNKYFLLLLILIIPCLVSAQSSSFETLENLKLGKQNSPYLIKQICSDATYINISSVSYPNSSTAVSNVQMVYSGGGTYYYWFNQTIDNGRYDVLGISDGCTKDFATYFIINRNGLDLSISQSLIYILLTIAVFFFFAFSFYFAIAIPYSNELNERGDILSITKLKYVKLFFIQLTYVLFLWFLNVLISVSDNFSTLNLYYGFISFIFSIFNRLSLTFSIIILIIAMFNIIKDVNLQESIKQMEKYT